HPLSVNTPPSNLQNELEKYLIFPLEDIIIRISNVVASIKRLPTLSLYK
ncbi:24762_t:CDS:1, partial [Cetraspora pellucida]